ncbi:type III secretion system cytoplasmic ring protein SctQ [Paraburkholderia sp. CI3]|uniref:type III secretion system cytoplasmic ring protein SctQ n=1 Tax=Paraburkholderia sp. CI3 TaxID=2991060 RepID=UPI003D2151E8
MKYAPSTVTSLAASLPAVAPLCATLWRVLADARLERWLDAAAQAVRVDALAEAESFGTPAFVVLGSVAGSARIEIDLDEHPALAPVISGSNMFAAQVATHLFAPCLAALRVLGLPDFTVRSIGLLPAGSERAVHVAINGDGLRFRFAVAQLDAPLVQTLAQRIDAQRGVPYRELASLKLPGHLVLGTKRLSVEQLRSLRPGDAVLGATPSGAYALLATDGQVDAVHQWGSPDVGLLIARGKLSRDKFEFKEALQMTDDTYGGLAAHPTAERDAQVAADRLEIPVQFEIDTLPLSIAQLNALRTGYVLDLPVPVADARIRLTAYGQTLGFGQLVAIGEHLGVRITELAQDHAADS